MDTFLESSKKHTDIYHRNIQFLATELFKVKNNILNRVICVTFLKIEI